MNEWVVNAPSGMPVIRLGRTASRGAVVLIGEVQGVDEALLGWARRLVDEEFTVALPDLWWRHGGAPVLGSDEAVSAAVSRLDDGHALRDVAAALSVLPPGVPRVAMGFCVGGLLARLATAALPGLAAGVEFYGRIVYPTLGAEKPAQPLDLLPGRACPLLCHFGELDAVAPPHHVDELERRLASQAVPGRVYRYPGVGHGFMNRARPTWDAAAAELAWQRTGRFLDEALPA